MILFLGVSLVLGLAFPGILILFAPTVFKLFMTVAETKKTKNVQQPELSLDAKIWPYIKKSLPEAVMFDFSLHNGREKLREDGETDITVKMLDGTIKPYVLFYYQAGEREIFGLRDKKMNDFSRTKIHFFTVPNTTDPVSTLPPPVTEPQEPEEPAPVPRTHSERPADLPVDYSAMAFEWVNAHIPEISEQLSMALEAGEDACLLDDSFLPKREAWNCVADELKNLCDLESEIKEIGIVVFQKQDVEVAS